MTLLFWATATWWIPMLRHPRRLASPHPPLSASLRPLYWGAVFPLGMYTVSTYRLGQVVDVPVLMVIPRLFIWVALLAWTAASVGLIGICSPGGPERRRRHLMTPVIPPSIGAGDT